MRSFLVARLLWLIVPIVVAGMAVLWHFERALLIAQFDAELVAKAKTLATLVTRSEGGAALEFADELMPEYSRPERPFVFQIWQPNGRYLERSFSLQGADLPFVHGTLERPATFEAVLPHGYEVRCVGIEFPERAGTDPAVNPMTSVVIALGADRSLLAASLRKGALVVALTGLLSVIGISVVVQLALRRGLHLIRRVVERLEPLAPVAAHRPLDESLAPLEIRPIVSSLNQSLGAVREVVERERRFNADVSHELRTPIAELRAASDVALRWPDSDTARNLPKQVREVACHMEGIVEGLLELATLEASEPGEVERFDLARCARAQVERARESARDGRSIELDVADRLPITSQQSLWEVVLRNLLENALCYSTPASRISLRIRADGDGALLCLSNPTQSLSEADLPRCTDRLWRAREASDESRHFGLGLSIVKAASDKLAHHLDVFLSEGVFHAVLSRSEPDRRREG